MTLAARSGTSATTHLATTAVRQLRPQHRPLTSRAPAHRSRHPIALDGSEPHAPARPQIETTIGFSGATPLL
jgi:hypothetical protein